MRGSRFGGGMGLCWEGMMRNGWSGTGAGVGGAGGLLLGGVRSYGCQDCFLMEVRGVLELAVRLL